MIANLLTASEMWPYFQTKLHIRAILFVMSEENQRKSPRVQIGPLKAAQLYYLQDFDHGTAIGDEAYGLALLSLSPATNGSGTEASSRSKNSLPRKMPTQRMTHRDKKKRYGVNRSPCSSFQNRLRQLTDSIEVRLGPPHEMLTNFFFAGMDHGRLRGDQPQLR